jgi:flavin reductase (DIM6/NTAB) family NADH-FMN oxidoreductase RutF
MISTVTPRPIALVSSRSKSGIDNVSPFSYFGAVAHDPPMLSIGFCRKGSDRVQKDSIANILETKEFAVNIISEWYLDAANQSCGEYKSDVDEFVESGLTKTDCQVISAPRVAEAAVTYECRVEHVYPVKDDDGRPTTEIVLARVVRVHVDREVLMDDFDPLKPVVDTAKLRPVGRLGGNTYCSIGETLDMARPRV